jgi:glycosyltransferase involved in cell wall biosynthesis
LNYLLELTIKIVIFEIMKHIILSVTNDLVTDQRVHRIATTLINNKAEVTLVGRLLPDSLPLQRKYNTYRMRLLFKKGPLFYAEYNIRLFFYLLFAKADILVSNDLDTLLANYLVSIIRRKVLVHDAHEYFTGLPEIQDRKLVLLVWQTIERFVFPKLQYIYTVNDSIARLYTEKYNNKNIYVVRNLPIKVSKDQWPNRNTLGLPADKKILIIQGAGINMHRGAEEAILAINYLTDVILLIIGEGKVVPNLKKMVSSLHLENNVMFKPKMPFEELICYTHLADVGLSLDKDTNINYRYSLPNKLFDYIQAGIPVLCSNLEEVAKIVNAWKIGMVAESHEPKYLAKMINEMLKNENQIELWKQNLAKAAEELCWENEEKELLKIYEKLP